MSGYPDPVPAPTEVVDNTGRAVWGGGFIRGDICEFLPKLRQESFQDKIKALLKSQEARAYYCSEVAQVVQSVNYPELRKFAVITLYRACADKANYARDVVPLLNFQDARDEVTRRLRL